MKTRYARGAKELGYLLTKLYNLLGHDYYPGRVPKELTAVQEHVIQLLKDEVRARQLALRETPTLLEEEDPAYFERNQVMKEISKVCRKYFYNK